jgi:hypothetical protein
MFQEVHSLSAPLTFKGLTIPASMFLELAARDLELREQLINDGMLFGGYNPEMEALHIAHGRILQEHIAEHGWPDEEGESKAAWLILVHAISMPQLQKNALAMFRSTETSVPEHMIAMLEDRILTLSGKKQKWGTQFDWDEAHELSPQPIEDVEGLDERRQTIGLDSLAECQKYIRQRAAEEGDHPNEDRDRFLLERLQWMVKVGWINSIHDVDPAYKPTFMR